MKTAAAKDKELHHIDAEQAFFEADIDKKSYIDIPQEFEKVSGVVGLLNKVIYGAVQVESCWNNKFCDDMTAIGFEQSNVDPCVFRRSLTHRWRWWWSCTWTTSLLNKPKISDDEEILC